MKLGKVFAKLIFIFLLLNSFLLTSCQPESFNLLDLQNENHSNKQEDDLELDPGQSGTETRCRQADLDQIAFVDIGLSKLDQFLAVCRAQTQMSAWCDQVARPNPASQNVFRCTYSPDQPPFLIHPDELTWNFAIEAVKIVKDLEFKNIRVCMIYNWWRPEPYNQNVGGAAGRHPFGTSVDVRFCSKADQLQAHQELCRMRKEGRLRALGYYSSTALHLGVGDRVANTWGKTCS